MIAPDVDASFAANSVRKNVIACKQSIQPTEDNSGCSYSCQDSKFSISGINCFYMSTTTETQAMAVSRCERIGAELATINNQAEDELVYRLMVERGTEVHAWIGLENIAKVFPAGTWAWQNRSTAVSYSNWLKTNGRQEPNGSGFCVRKVGSQNGA